MFVYKNGMYSSTKPEKSYFGASSNLWFIGNNVVVKTAKNKSGEKGLEQEYHTNRLYKYVLDKGLNRICSITVPEVRLAGKSELSELKGKGVINDRCGTVLIQEFKQGFMMNDPSKIDGSFVKSNLVENKGFLGSIGVLAGLDVAFYNTDRLGVHPIFSHFGNLGNILAHARENGAAPELVAIDNVSTKLKRLGMENVQRKLDRLTEKGVGEVGEDILKRMLKTTENNIKAFGGQQPSFEPDQLSTAGKTLGLGFMQGLIWMHDFLGDKEFEKIRKQVDDEDGGDNVGVISSTLTTLNEKGNKIVQNVMEEIRSESSPQNQGEGINEASGGGSGGGSSEGD
jgi:hypothetical protein